MSSWGEVRWLLELARPQRMRLVVAVLLGAAAAAASVALMGTAAYLIARASEQPPVLTLTVAIVGVRFFGISRAVARYTERLVGHDAAFRVVSDLRVAVYRRVEPLVPARIDDRSSGDVLTRFSVDVDTISDAYLRVFPPFAIAGVVGVGTVVVLASIDPLVGVALMIGLAVNAVLVPRFVGASVTAAQRALASVRTRHTEQVLELLEVLPETWVADTSAPFVDRVQVERTALLKAELSASHASGAGQAAGVLVAGLTVLACLVIGTESVASGSVDGVLLAVLVLTPLAAFELVAPLPDAARRWAAVTAATTRVRELFDTGPETPNARTGRLADGTFPSASGDPAQLVLHDVTVRWPGADAPTLHAVSLTVPTGGHVAVVGPSGSGKSTLAMTLAGFLSPEEGALEIAGVDSRDWDEADRHASVGLLEQHPYLFDTTVEQNLLLARPDASPAALGKVLERVGLGPWASGLPQGLDTRVGEHGRRLSGGQQQRLGLARLLLADHPTLVLDEPDEHLDALSADALMADLLKASGDRTTVVISHRLVPLTGVDLIVVLDGGRVTEAGAHGELVARGGWYARAWMREQEIGAAVAAARR